MGPSAPRPEALFPTRRSAEAGRKIHHSDGDVLHQLDSLRRARETAVTETSK
jgi:hypothetical protein